MTEMEMKAREKVEHTEPAEGTRDLPVFIPHVDIFESAEALTLVADMPGVGSENVSIDIHENVLTVRGNVTPEQADEQMLAQEFGIGDYYRQFTLGRTIDQARIEASMKDGVLTLTLPKAEASKPRRITVKGG
jgi:HSP20 family protein